MSGGSTGWTWSIWILVWPWYLEGVERWTVRGIVTALVLAAAACGVSTPPAAAPTEDSPERMSPTPSPAAAVTEGVGGAAGGGLGDGGSAPTEPAADDGSGDPTGPDAVAAPDDPPAPPPMPRDVLVSDGVAFLLDDPGSGLKDALTERCRQQATQDDPAKLAACRAEARDEFAADVLVFKNQPDGAIRWIVYQRSGTVLKEVHSAEVELVGETATSFKLRSRGGQGTRPLYAGRGDVPVQMPSRHELVIDDPKYGRLVYRAKFGLVGR